MRCCWCPDSFLFVSWGEVDWDIGMVPTPFTWRYGGHQVSLFGSFNGWSEGTPMALLEGSGTVFQILFDLPPGCYQYKFLVDGAWRIDRQQRCVPDENGTINNIVVVNGTRVMSLDLNADAFLPSTSGVNEDMSVGSSSGVPRVEPSIQQPSADMDVFRQVLSMHLSSTTAYELIPISGKVDGLDVDVGVEDAFHVMFELGLSVVPLWDEHIGQLVGMLTALDFILILLQLTRNHTMFADLEHEMRTISSWKAWKHRHHQDIVETMPPLMRRPLIHAGPDEPLGEVASRIMQNNISAVPIIDSVNGSCPRLLLVVCLAGILRSVCRHFIDHFQYLPFLQQPIGYLPIGTWATDVRGGCARPLLTIRPNDPLSYALTLLLEAQISSVPIVDDGGNIINVYSRSDITSLAKDNIYTHVQLNHMTVSQALEVAIGGGRSRYQTCTRFDPLLRVMQLLSEPGVHRLIVLQASTRRVEGIITLRDIFNFFSQ